MRRYDLPSARGLVRVEPVGAAADRRRLGRRCGRPGRLRRAARRAEPALRRRPVARPSCAAPWPPAGSWWSPTPIAARPSCPGRWTPTRAGCSSADETVSADGLILDPSSSPARRPPGAPMRPSPSTPACATCRRRSRRRPVSSPSTLPFAALDGSPPTAWLADPSLTPDQRWLQVDFTAPARRRRRRSAARARRATAPCARWGSPGGRLAVHAGLEPPRARPARGRRAAGHDRRGHAPAGGGRPARAASPSCGSPACTPPRPCACPLDGHRGRRRPGCPGAGPGSATCSRAQTGDDPFARDPAAASRRPAGVSSPVGHGRRRDGRCAACSTSPRRAGSPRRPGSRRWPRRPTPRSIGWPARAAPRRRRARTALRVCPGSAPRWRWTAIPATAWVGSWAPPSRPWLAVALPAAVGGADGCG